MIENMKCWPLKKPVGNIKANIQFAVGDFVIKGRVMSGKNGLFVSLPSRQYEKEGEKQYTDEVYVLTDETRKELNDKAMGAYNKATGNDSMNQGLAPDATNQSDDIPFG